jgi:adenosylhomocysteine nucleosidase
VIAFVVALKSEAEYFIKEIECLREEKLAGKVLYTGKYHDKDIALILSGVGKVNASLATQAVIDKFSPELVFNFGTAGGANESVKHMTYYVIDKCCQYDFDLSELDGCSVGYMSEFDGIYFNNDTFGVDFLEYKTLTTADMFSNKIENINTVRKLGGDARDMEGSAVAQVCKLNGVKLFMLKGITDTYDNPAKEFYINLTTVCKGFPEVISKVLDKIYNV